MLIARGFAALGRHEGRASRTPEGDFPPHMSPENRLDFIHGKAVNFFAFFVTKAVEGSFQNCKSDKIMLPDCEHYTQQRVERPQHLVPQKLSIHNANRIFHKNFLLTL